MPEIPQPRSLAESAVETVLFTASMASIPLAVHLAIFGFSGLAAGYEAIIVVGSVAYSNLSWTLGVYITTLLAFYAVSVGGQVLRVEDAPRVRRILGGVAEMLVGACVVMVAYVCATFWAYPDRLGILVVLLPMTGVVCFLGLTLGGFVVFEQEIRLASARSGKREAARWLARYAHRTRVRPAFGVVLANVATIYVLSVLPLLVIGGFGGGWFYGIWLLLVAVLVAGAFVAVAILRSREDWFTKCLVLVLPAIICLGCAYLIIRLLAAGEYGILVAIALVVALVLASLTAALPVGRAPRWYVNWALRGAIYYLLARIELRRYVENARVAHALSPRTVFGEAEPTPVAGGVRSWLNWLKRRSDTSPPSLP